MFRAGEMSFARVPVDGSSKMPDAHMDAIEPFDYSDLAPFSMAYLPGFAADRFDQDQETCHQRAECRMASSMEQALRDTVEGYDSVTTQSCDAAVAWQGAEYCLLPVWMLYTSWRGKGFLFAMNGQTGKLVGDLPVSAFKVIAWFAGVFAVALAVVTAAIMGLDHFGGRCRAANRRAVRYPRFGGGVCLPGVLLPDEDGQRGHAGKCLYAERDL